MTLPRLGFNRSGFLFCGAILTISLLAPATAPCAEGTVSYRTDQPAAADKRKPSPPLSSLPVPAAAGPLRVLLVDDDVSDNNYTEGDKRVSVSDKILRQLIEESVGKDPKAWEIEYVRTNSSGPGFDRLKDFSLVIWYTGASYGGNPDNTSVLSVEDEKAVRRYLEEKGGAVILISPGYVSKVLDNESNWDNSTWPFLTKVMGIRGGVGLAQRFLPGSVSSAAGTQFQVGAGSAALESQYSLVHPDGAAVVFSSRLTGAKAGTEQSPVATAFPYGKGRMVYVGFTFENLTADDLRPAFQELLAATGLVARSTATAVATTTTPTATTTTGVRPEPALPTMAPPDVARTVASQPAAVPPPVVRTPVTRGQPAVVRPVTTSSGGMVEVAPAPVTNPTPDPAPATNPPPAAADDGLGNRLLWTSETKMKAVKVRIYTGNDDKESPSYIRVTLHRNGGGEDTEMYGVNGTGAIAANSTTEYVLLSKLPSEPYGQSLSSCQQSGLRLVISYSPNFPLDAWKIDRVEMDIEFGFSEDWRTTFVERGKRISRDSTVVRTAPGYPKTIVFNNHATLLSQNNRELTLVTDGFFFPQ